MALKLKKLSDSPPGTIVSAVKSMTEDPEAQYSTVNRWLLCDGQTLDSVTNPEYTALFNVIGTKYGGSGASSFMIPNMHGVTSKSTSNVGDDANTVLIRGHSDYNNFNAGDEVSNRNNTRIGSLSGNSANLEGTITSNVQSNLVNSSVSGKPNGAVNRSTGGYQLTTRNWPDHNHSHARCAKQRDANTGFVNSGGTARDCWRQWVWYGDNRAHGAVGGNTSHSHGGNVAYNNVSGNIDVTHNLSATPTHNFSVNVSGIPAPASVVNKHSEVRFYIKF